MKKTIIIFSTFLAAMPAALMAQTGAQFLRIDTDARLSGMASAGAASVYGISALNYNPAGLSAMTGPEAAFSHSKWLMDASHDFAGFGFKTAGIKGGKVALGVGVTRLSNTSLDGRGDDRSVLGGYSAYDQVVTLGAAVNNIGCAVKYIQGSIAGVRAETFAIDLGAKQKLTGAPVTLGLGVQNLGRGLKYISQRDQLPLSVNAGVSVMAMPGMGLVLDVKRLVYDKETIISLGTEYAMLMTPNGAGFALRGGYGLAGLAARDGKSGISVGAGVMALGAQLDYAVSPETGLGSVQRLTLKKRF